MMAYLGETIIREFGGSWETEGNVKIGSTLFNLGSWVDKRLRNGMQDSITMKVDALLAPKQAPQWSPYWEEGRGKASQFGHAIQATAADIIWVDNWINKWLMRRKRYEMNDWEEPDFDEVNNELEQKFSEMSCQMRKYLWGRLIKLWGGLQWGDFCNMINYTIYVIKGFIEAIDFRTLGWTSDELVQFSTYLIGTPVGPNSRVFEFIWNLERHAKFFKLATQKLRSQFLSNLLILNAEREFHHDINDFKKILKLINSDNEDVIEGLNDYTVKKTQGCYLAIRYIFEQNFKGVLAPFEQFKCRKQIIEWLDSSAGKIPKTPWLNNLSQLQSFVATEDLQSVGNWIISHKEWS